jgi:LPXTG-motif cell wall-anchored protein
MRQSSRHSLRLFAVLASVLLVAVCLAVVVPTSDSTATPASVWGTEPAITLGSDPVEIAAGDDGSIWVVDATDDTLTEITNVAGVSIPQTPIALAADSQPTGVTVDLDGNVWVGLKATGQVQQIVYDAGTWIPQTPIAIGKTGTTMSLNTSPDGSIWVVFFGTSNVQPIVETGAGWAAESMLTADRGIDEVVFDTNGVGWLMHPSEAITKLVETGGVWSLDPPMSTPFRANWGAPGPNGSLYLSDGGCRVFSFVPATQTSPLTGYPSCDTDSLAATSDSSFWLTSSGSGSVDRWSSTTFNLVERFIVGGQPRDLTPSTDGSLWFVNKTSHKVQQISFREPIASSITSASSETFPMGTSTTFTVTTSGGFPFPIIRTADPLPYGVTLTDNHDGTATLAGAARPGAEGVYSIEIEAVNGEFVTTQNFTLTVPGTPPNSLTVFFNGQSGGWNTCSVNSMASTAGNFWVASPGGNILRYTTDLFSLAENMSVGGSPSQITTATDGTVWFIDETANNVRSIALSGGAWTVSDPITVGSSPRFLTVGANGSIWVADTVDDTVSQITNLAGAKTVAETVSISGTTLAGLTTGLDGSIWAADRGAGALIRISQSAGTGAWFAEAPITLSQSNREMVLATGPDGDIWVAFRSANQVQSVKNVSGTWTAQSALTAAGSFTIAAGPGGTMWVGAGNERATQLVKIEGTWVPLLAIPAAQRTQYVTVTDGGSMWWSDGGCALFEWKSVVGVAPAITTSATGSMRIGENSEITLSATGTPKVTFSKVGNLPEGVSFNVNSYDSGATFSGTPSNSVTPGDYTFKIIADNGAYRAAVQEFTLTISAPTPTTTTTEVPTTTTTVAPTTTTTTVAPTTTAAPTTTTVAPTTTTRPTSVLNESQIAQLPSAQLTRAKIAKAAKVRVRMSGFQPRERVQLTVASTPIVVGEVDADGDGAIDTEVEIPADLDAGEHHLATYGLTSGIGFSQVFMVEAEDGSALPATGSDSNRLLLVGGAFALMGSAMAAMAARRRQEIAK